MPIWSNYMRRIIPARAGFTYDMSAPAADDGDHPRSRGVYGGEPPPVSFGARIIPARAGFTRMCVICHAFVWDHPRSRGVYFRDCQVGGGYVGSSPLARGLRCGLAREYRVARIIPARAGVTSALRRTAALSPDHPRSRGVYSRWRRPGPTECGSSPLARGLRGGAGRGPGRPGIIPARAGFTSPTEASTPQPWDHPRSRGVYAVPGEVVQAQQGSSPLARGLPSASPRPR